MGTFNSEVLIVTLVSIVALASLAGLLRRTSLRLCPICTGVSLTWIWQLLVWRQTGWGDLILLGILMGGSVVGLVYTTERKLNKPSLGIWWKAILIPLGFMVVYGILASFWLISSAALGMGLVMAFTLRSKKSTAPVSKEARALEEKMKKCC